MRELPTAWCEAGLFDLAQLVRGVTYSKSDARNTPENDYIPVLRATNLTDRGFNFNELVFVPKDLVADNQMVTCGDVVVATSSGSISVVGKAVQARSNLEAGFGAFCGLIRPHPSMNFRYFGYFFSTEKYRSAVSSMARGVNINNLKREHFESISLPIAPLNEQKRIADKLDTLLVRVDACRERLDRVPQILKRFRQAVLAAATSGVLTEEWREKSGPLVSAEARVNEIEAERLGRLRVRAASASMEMIDLEDLPEGWSWIKNNRLATDSPNSICAGPFGTIFKAKDFRSEGIPIIFLRHVREGSYNTNKPGFMDKDVWREYHQPYSVYGGELLVAKLGDPPGTACIYPKNIGIAMVTPDVMKMEVDARVAAPEYLMYFFNSAGCKKLIEELAFGVTRLRIDIAMFKNFPIPLPPIEEQQEIIRRVETLFGFADRLEDYYISAHSKVDQLTPALLDKAFRGKLVPQDPTDEPAEKLLERVLSAKAGETIKPKRKFVGRKSMMKITAETVKAVITEMPKDTFSFDELRKSIPGDYEALKDAVFILLGEPAPTLQQFFDPEEQSIRFRRV